MPKDVTTSKLFRACKRYADHSESVCFITQPKTRPKTSRPRASATTSGVEKLPRAYQPGKWTRTKRREEAKLARQKLVACQNLFKRKPRK